MPPELTIKCIELKNDIQSKLLRATKGLSSQEIKARRHAHLEHSSSPIAQWWHRLTSRQPIKK